MCDWRLLRVHPLQLSACLAGGQSFRWKFDEYSNIWTGVFRKTVWNLKQDDEGLQYKVIGSLQDKDTDFENMLKNYFHLDYDLEKLYKQWSKSDKLFASAADKFYGVRILAQETIENIFSFICSQNNNISRISSMIENLCNKYGEKICNDNDGIEYYAFPDVNRISDKTVDQELRELKFGYRSKFIQQSAKKIVEWGNEEWINSLKVMPYKDAKLELIKLPGIGPKVADCICLMSLEHLEAVPVDTHVFQIAAKNYLKHLKGSKSVTTKIYNEIGDHFRTLYGPLAGWAHTILFCADLKKFNDEDNKQKQSGRIIKKEK